MSSLPKSRFSAQDRRTMLSLAREAILSALQGKPLHHTAWESSCLSERQGVFVTLEVQGKLRGCIGVIEAHNSLRESIVHCAQSAALRDSRFPPLSADELDALQIEISVLSVLSKMDPREIEIGTHGLVIAAGEKRGLLLPQVATEQHLSREQFLQETCRKAGLSRHAWQESATSVYGFTCEIFREDSRSANA